jgi:superfamily II DNA/RNA helicase
MKTPILIELLKRLQDKIVIVFVNNKLLLDNLVLELKNEKLKALGIHGNME